MTPANPYAASKAGGEQMCLAYFRTYDLPVVVSRSANNIGPYQHPEKAVPLFVTNALDDQPLPVYGEGLQIRDRLYVEDNCEALDLLLHKGVPGEVYNVGADNERTNIEVANTILDAAGASRASLIRFVPDRTGHDERYSLDTSKIRALGWQPRHDYESAMEKTVSLVPATTARGGSGSSPASYAAYYRKQYTAAPGGVTRRSRRRTPREPGRRSRRPRPMSCGCIGRLRISLQTVLGDRQAARRDGDAALVGGLQVHRHRVVHQRVDASLA